MNSLLKQSGIYYRLRSSLVYDFYLAMTNRKLLKEKYQEIAFYRTLLDGFAPGDLIFDVGANIGDKIDIFLKLGMKVVAIDPDQVSQRVLRQRFLNYRLKPKPVHIVAKAAAATAGTETMMVRAPRSVFNTLSGKGADTYRAEAEPYGDTLNFSEDRTSKVVETTTLDLLIEEYGSPFLIKIDVVGFEIEVLQGLHHAVPFISFEIRLPEFRQELQRCVEILDGLSHGAQFNFTWNRGKGLVLINWLDVQEFLKRMNSFGEGPLEIFYRATR